MAKVIVAMSGGVDSSVTAYLLREAGHEVIGVFMRHGIHQADARSCRVDDEPAQHRADRQGRANRQGCCSAEDAADARRVAKQLDIPFYALNFEDAFAGIIDYFVDEYARGRTPNPCVRCNTYLKFGRLWQYAQAVEADYIATGHYARVGGQWSGTEQGPGGRGLEAASDWSASAGTCPQPLAASPSSCPQVQARGPVLCRGLDRNKDQSYVLFGIRRAMLARMWLPVGGMAKPKVREIAREAGLLVGDKPDSYEICFVPNDDYASLVASRVPQAFEPGAIVDTAGRRLGTHRGLPNYTIGQRHGLGVAAGEPVFVTEIRMGSNTLVVGRRPEVLRSALAAMQANWLIDPPAAGQTFRACCQIRANHVAAACDVTVTAAGFYARFDEPQHAVTPGQAAVLYDPTDTFVLGGGWIE